MSPNIPLKSFYLPPSGVLKDRGAFEHESAVTVVHWGDRWPKAGRYPDLSSGFRFRSAVLIFSAGPWFFFAASGDATVLWGAAFIKGTVDSFQLISLCSDADSTRAPASVQPDFRARISGLGGVFSSFSSSFGCPELGVGRWDIRLFFFFPFLLHKLHGGWKVKQAPQRPEQDIKSWV